MVGHAMPAGDVLCLVAVDAVMGASECKGVLLERGCHCLPGFIAGHSTGAAQDDKPTGPAGAWCTKP